MTEQKIDRIKEDRLFRWQNKLLPFMVCIILLMAIFFFFASMYQLQYLQKEVRHKTFDIQPVMEEYEKILAGNRMLPNEQYINFKINTLLEQNVVERRYHQTNSAMLSRIWTRYMGFITGMILALVGAAFILGKFSEGPTKIETESQLLKASIYSSSPGLVLAFLGTVLMCITLIVPFEIGTRDMAVYKSEWKIPAPSDWKEDYPFDIKAQEDSLFNNPKSMD